MSVIPAKAGTQLFAHVELGPGFRRDDGLLSFDTELCMVTSLTRSESMKRMLASLACALFAGNAVASQFCSVTSGGTNCNHISLDGCYQALRGMGGGQCVVNPQALPQPAASSPVYTPVPVEAWKPPEQKPQGSFYEAGQRGADAGIRQRQQREEHEARMALLKAQTEAAQVRSGQTPKPEETFDWGALKNSVEAQQGIRQVVYSCNGQQTTYPSIGCVVIGFGE